MFSRSWSVPESGIIRASPRAFSNQTSVFGPRGCPHRITDNTTSPRTHAFQHSLPPAASTLSTLTPRAPQLPLTRIRTKERGIHFQHQPLKKRTNVCNVSRSFTRGTSVLGPEEEERSDTSGISNPSSLLDLKPVTSESSSVRCFASDDPPGSSDVTETGDAIDMAGSSRDRELLERMWKAQREGTSLRKPQRVPPVPTKNTAGPLRVNGMPSNLDTTKSDDKSKSDHIGRSRTSKSARLQPPSKSKSTNRNARISGKRRTVSQSGTRRVALDRGNPHRVRPIKDRRLIFPRRNPIELPQRHPKTVRAAQEPLEMPQLPSLAGPRNAKSQSGSAVMHSKPYYSRRQGSKRKAFSWVLLQSPFHLRMYELLRKTGTRFQESAHALEEEMYWAHRNRYLLMADSQHIDWYEQLQLNRARFDEIGVDLHRIRQGICKLASMHRNSKHHEIIYFAPRPRLRESMYKLHGYCHGIHKEITYLFRHDSSMRLKSEKLFTNAREMWDKFDIAQRGSLSSIWFTTNLITGWNPRRTLVAGEYWRNIGVNWGKLVKNANLIEGLCFSIHMSWKRESRDRRFAISQYVMEVSRLGRSLSLKMNQLVSVSREAQEVYLNVLNRQYDEESLQHREGEIKAWLHAFALENAELTEDKEETLDKAALGTQWQTEIPAMASLREAHARRLVEKYTEEYVETLTNPYDYDDTSAQYGNEDSGKLALTADLDLDTSESEGLELYRDKQLPAYAHQFIEKSKVFSRAWTTSPQKGSIKNAKPDKRFGEIPLSTNMTRTDSPDTIDISARPRMTTEMESSASKIPTTSESRNATFRGAFFDETDKSATSPPVPIDNVGSHRSEFDGLETTSIERAEEARITGVARPGAFAVRSISPTIFRPRVIEADRPNASEPQYVSRLNEAGSPGAFVPPHVLQPKEKSRPDSVVAHDWEDDDLGDIAEDLEHVGEERATSPGTGDVRKRHDTIANNLQHVAALLQRHREYPSLRPQRDAQEVENMLEEYIAEERHYLQKQRELFSPDTPKEMQDTFEVPSATLEREKFRAGSYSFGERLYGIHHNIKFVTRELLQSTLPNLLKLQSIHTLQEMWIRKDDIGYELHSIRRMKRRDEERRIYPEYHFIVSLGSGLEAQNRAKDLVIGVRSFKLDVAFTHWPLISGSQKAARLVREIASEVTYRLPGRLGMLWFVKAMLSIKDDRVFLISAELWKGFLLKATEVRIDWLELRRMVNSRLKNNPDVPRRAVRPDISALYQKYQELLDALDDATHAIYFRMVDDYRMGYLDNRHDTLLKWVRSLARPVSRTYRSKSSSSTTKSKKSSNTITISPERRLGTARRSVQRRRSKVSAEASADLKAGSPAATRLGTQPRDSSLGNVDQTPAPANQHLVGFDERMRSSSATGYVSLRSTEHDEQLAQGSGSKISDNATLRRQAIAIHQRKNGSGETPPLCSFSPLNLSQSNPTAYPASSFENAKSFDGTMVTQEESTERPADTTEQSDQSPTYQVAPSTDAAKLEQSQLEHSASNTIESTLDYKIPKEVYEDALAKQSSSSPTYWNYNLYLSPDGKRVPCHYVRKIDAAEGVAKLFVNEKLIGFDLEWNPGLFGFKKNSIKDNVSLIQIASETRVALFHVSLHYGDTVEELVSPTLKEILRSPAIMKAGVSISADCTRVHKHLGIEMKGQFELSHLHNLVKHAQSEPKKVTRRLVNLAAQVEEHLGLPLAKGEVRQSDWTKELNMQQIIYAASDAYAAVHLFDVLNQKRLSMNPTPPLPAFAEQRVAIDLGKLAPVVDSSSSSEDDFDIDDEEDHDDDESTPQPTETKELPIRTRSRQSAPTSSKSTATPLTKSTSDSSSAIPESPEATSANAWVADYRSTMTSPAPSTSTTSPSTSTPTATQTQQKNRATPAHLRSYALWHHQSLSVTTITSLLRNPPLQKRTVANYIASAIQLEGLPYDRQRLLEVMGGLSDWERDGRYRRLWEDCRRSQGGSN